MADVVRVALEQGQHVQVRVAGRGEPVLLIQTALNAEELVPLAHEPSIADHHRVIDSRRRGYSSSSPARRPGSVARDAADCLAVLHALDAVPAHVVGVSYSAAVALALAAAAPDAVATLALAEPPPRHAASAREFLAATEGLIDTHERHGAIAALDQFTRIFGDQGWLDERGQLPIDMVERFERDAETFFSADVPALRDWQFGPEQAVHITQPVVYLTGAATHPWFVHVGQWVAEMLPQVETHVIPGAGHDLPVTHSEQVAVILRDFYTRHPIRG